MLEKTLGDVGEDIREDGDDMSSLSSLRCQGRHVFSIFLEMLGKSSLPCLCLRCWGRHVFPIFPEMLGKTFGDVGEDNWRCWGRQEHWERHSRLSGRTSRTWDHTGEVRDDGEDIRDDLLGKTSGRSGMMRKTSRVFPVFASRCHGRHDGEDKSSLSLPEMLGMTGKTSGRSGEDGDDIWGGQGGWG